MATVSVSISLSFCHVCMNSVRCACIAFQFLTRQLVFDIFPSGSLVHTPNYNLHTRIAHTFGQYTLQHNIPTGKTIPEIFVPTTANFQFIHFSSNFYWEFSSNFIGNKTKNLIGTFGFFPFSFAEILKISSKTK